MKVAYKHLIQNIADKPNISDLSQKLFQLGHEHEINEEIFDLDLTPNRGDCLSVKGLLRDLKLFYDVKVDNNIYENKINNLKIDFTNNVETFCPHISFLKVEIDKIPEIYSDQLEFFFNSLDIKKNNFFTDISNYIAYETGQPTHCYDASTIRNKIILDSLDSKQSFETLTKKIITLDKGEIAFFNDAREIINLPGVMGGKNTACKKETTSVLIECAYFNPEMILGKTLKYSINSDAAYKFERNVDPSCHEYVLRRFLKIIEDHANIINVELYEKSVSHYKKQTVFNDLDKINAILGSDISTQTSIKYLENLGFEVKDDCINVPMHRHDINNVNDIAEEIARGIGYDNIDPIEFKIDLKRNFKRNNKETKIKAILIENGFNEVINDSFASDCNDLSLKVDNPLDSNRGYLRTSLKNSLIKNLSYNERRQKDIVKLFEISDVYFSGPNDKKRLLGIIASGRIDYNFKDFQKKISEKYLANIINNHISTNKILNYEIIPRDNLSSKSKDPIIYIEIEINSSLKVDYELNKNKKNKKNFKYFPISEFPSSNRDLSFSIKEFKNSIVLQDYLLNYKNKLIRNIFIFDYFHNKKSQEIKIAFRLVFQDINQTITEVQIKNVMNDIIEHTTKIEGVSIPGLN